jgi:hypothetical protein
MGGPKARHGSGGSPAGEPVRPPPCGAGSLHHGAGRSPVHPRTFARRYSEPVWSCDPTRTCPQLLIPGSARTRHRFGDEAGSRERTTGKIDTWAVTGPSNVKKHREAWRNSERIPPGQPCSVSPMPQMAKYGADELP